MSNTTPEDHDSRVIVLPQGAFLSEEAPVAPSEGGGFNLRYVLASVRSNLQLIGIVFGLMMALSIVFTLLQTPRYTAKASVQINNATSRVLSKEQDDQNDTDAESPTDTDRFLKTQIEIFNSRSLALRVAKKLNLTHNAHFFEASGAKPQPGDSEAVVTDRMITLLHKNTEVSLGRESRVVDISFESADPRLAADITNAYASEFIQQNLKRRFDSSSYARDFVGNQLAESKHKLEDSERALNAYARQAGLIRMPSTTTSDTSNKATNQGGSVTTASLLLTNQAANDAKAKRIAAEARWQAINNEPLMSAAEVVSNAGVSSLLSQKAQIEVALEEERSRHLADYPTVKSRQAQLASINHLIQVTATSIRNSVKADYQAAAQAENQLNTQVDKLKHETLNEQDRDVQYGLLAREVDTNREVYDGLLQRLKELNASAGISISNVSVIDSADVPLLPSSPNLVKNLGLSLALSLLLCIAVVVIKDQFDDSVRIPEDIESKLSLPLLGVIPRATDGDPEHEMVDPKSSLAEAYNSMRTSLMYGVTGGMPKIMQITSAQPGEGKTTTSYAIAIAFARMDKRVLLIDADLRRPSLHRRIDYDNARGLSSLVASQDALASVVQGSAIPNLSLVTSGPIPPSPTELISSARMREVMEEAARHFDVVLIDSPPVLGLADAPTIATFVEGVIFVVEADRSRHGSLKSALRRLRASHAKILGGVLTKFDPLRPGNRYSSYYGYDYYQYNYSYRETPET